MRVSVLYVLGFNYFTSVWCRWAPVRGALPSLHYDDDDDDECRLMTYFKLKIKLCK